MSKIQFMRPLNKPDEPRVPSEEVIVKAPGEIPEIDPQPKWKSVGMPLIIGVVMIAMVAMMFRLNKGQMNPLFMLMPLIGVFAMMGMMRGSGGANPNAQLLVDRKAAARDLGKVRGKATGQAREFHAHLQYGLPDPAVIESLIGTERMWEVTGTSERFALVRYGRGRIRPSGRIPIPEAPDHEFLDPAIHHMTVKFLHTHTTLPDMPLGLQLRQHPVFGIGGDRDKARGMVRAMLQHAAVMHGPDNLRIVVLTDDVDDGPWSYLKWYNHTSHPEEYDGIGPRRMIYSDWGELLNSLGSEDEAGGFGVSDSVIDFSKPHQVDDGASAQRQHNIILVDSGRPAILVDDAIRPVADVTWLLMDPPEEGALTSTHGVVLTVDEAGVVTRTDADTPLEPPKEIAIADYVDVEDARSAARSVFRYETLTSDSVTVATAQKGRDWPTLMGIDDVGSIDVVRRWGRITSINDRRRLRVPIGFLMSGERYELDLKEPGQGGTGPHGRGIGTSGSGKSELLRNIVLNLCVDHPPSMLNMLLIDFKGGSTFKGMDDIPHVSAVVSNLEQSESMVARMKQVVLGELKRRQTIWDAAASRYPEADIKGLTEYEAAREAGADLEPIPALFVLVDEYTELLEAHPDFNEVFAAIGRIGRSCGVHLALFSQSDEMDRSKNLGANVGWHLALRTELKSESRSVIGVPDAASLPPQPGNGLIKTKTSEGLVRFVAGYTAEKYFPPVVAEDDDQLSLGQQGAPAFDEAAATTVRPFTVAEVALPEANVVVEEEVIEQVRSEEEKRAAPTIFYAVLQQMRGKGTPAYRMWKEPLDVVTLDEVDPRLVPAAWQAPRAEDSPQLKVTLGKFDDADTHQQPPWEVDLGGPGGHVLVITEPQMGKSTAVMTLTTALAQLNHASQVQFYIIDYAGGGLGQLQGLPHVGAVVGRSERDGISRIISQMKELKASRERLFQKHQISSMSAYRQLRRDQSSPVHAEDPYGDVFLVIDGYDGAVGEGEALYDRSSELESLMSGSLNYGIHVVITTSKAMATHRINPLLKTVIEGYQSEISVIGSQRAKKVEKKPGHAITFEPALPGLVALPRTDGDRDLSTLSLGLAEVVQRVSAAHSGVSAPILKALPESITVSELFAQVQPARSDRERHRVPFGLRESTYRPAMADFWASPHMMIVGEKASGKSELISTLIEGICLRYPTKKDAVIALFDPARAHSGEFARTEEQVVCYGSTMDFFAEMEQEVLQKYAKAPTDRSMDAATGVPEEYRVVPPGVDAGDRSWWDGPEIFIIVDDYQIIAPRGVDSPVHSFRQLMRQGQTRGIHVIIARSTAEYQVSAFSDPLIKLLLEEQAQTMVLSADRMEVQFGTIRGQQFIQPGRGQLVFRAQAERVQSAWSGRDRDEKFDD